MYLGIDLGTSNSAIVGYDGSDLRLFKTAEGTDVLPSVIYIDKRGNKLIGTRAYANTYISRENIAEGFKRLMGTSSPISFSSADIQMSPEECSAEIIRTLHAQAILEAGDFNMEGAIVTIPAAFNQMQIEATIRAAYSAGLEKVGLLQEPIAAAMATMVKLKNKNGQFLIYDLGGGTFDVALVQVIGGTVNIIAHEGINMHGGRDYDRLLVNQIIRPWLIDNFSLPTNFQGDNRYRRLVGIARHAAEIAKIQLSTSENAIIFADDEAVRVKDQKENDIYISTEISRKDFEEMISEHLEDTIQLCHKILKNNGYDCEDIDNIILIGGPSKMPCVRSRVPKELGIPADLRTDPMTAVAKGAAIFAESREWLAETTKRKSSRSSETVKGPINIRYDFQERISESNARIKIISPTKDLIKGYSLQIDSDEGWTSGRQDLTDDLTIDIRVMNDGINKFRIIVYDPSGVPVSEAYKEIEIFKSHASAAGIPASQNISVMVIDTKTGNEKNELEILVSKGTLLPAEGSKTFRAAKNLRGGHAEYIDVNIYQQADEVPEPELNLFLGSFRIDAECYLFEEDYLRKGDNILIHWKMDDHGSLKCTLELPTLGRVLDSVNIYADIVGNRNFEGNEGSKLATDSLLDAERDLKSIGTILDKEDSDEIKLLQRKLDRQKETLSNSTDAESRRSITEEARIIQQEVSRIKHSPENRAVIIIREMKEIKEEFDQEVRERADVVVNQQFDQLIITLNEAVQNENIQAAERALNTLEDILYKELWNKPSYLIYLFKIISDERYRTIDKKLHDEHVSDGKRAIADNKIEKLREILFSMFDNRVTGGTTRRHISAKAGLERG